MFRWYAPSWSRRRRTLASGRHVLLRSRHAETRPPSLRRRRLAHPEERHAARPERSEQQAEHRPHRRMGPGNRALQRPQKRERGGAVRCERQPHQGGAGALPEREDLLGLAALPRPEGRRGGHHLHGRPSPRVHRQLGAEPQHARLLREAARHQRRRDADGARQLPEQAREARDAARHAAPRLSELRAGARADPRRRDRRTEDGARVGCAAVAAPGLSGGRRHGALVPALRAVDRTVAVPSRTARNISAARRA